MLKSCLFREQFRSLHEDAAKCYLKHQKEEFYKKFYWILALQNEILKQDPTLEEVLSKEYQHKIVTRENTAILKTFTDHGTSKIWMNKSILFFLICLRNIIITKDLHIRCSISLVFLYSCLT